jgi:glycerol-3-phosphate dehydrogenase
MPMPGAKFGRFSDFVRREEEENPKLGRVGHLAQLYGSNLPAMLAQAGNRPELLEPLGTTGDIAAQVLYALREEMALTLDDVLMRRTGIGQLGRPDSETIAATAKLMAAEFGWTDERRLGEIASVASRFALQAPS